MVPYPGFPFARTHPDHLGALARRHGVAARAAEDCAVVELACGDGLNVLAMVAAVPGLRALGVDIDAEAIARGRAVAEALGLGDRLELRVGDLLDGVDAEPAHYVICHGLYTWAPPRVADAALGELARLLGPDGVGFLSYNLRPGWTVRRALGPALARLGGEPRARLAELAFDVEDPYGALMAAEARRLAESPDALLHNDDLGPHTTAAWQADVDEHAAHHGLEVLCDALPGAPADDLASGRPYREVLLVPAGVGRGAPREEPPPGRHATAPGERPLAFALARLQARAGTDVTTLAHHRLRIADDAGRAILVLCDGTHDRAAIARATGLPEADVSVALENLAAAALLHP